MSRAQLFERSGLILATTLLLACGAPEAEFLGKKIAALDTFYAGVDMSSYPGDVIMQDLWSHTNLYVTGFYLAPAPHHRNASWMTKQATLRSMGWGLVPFYFGKQQQAAAGIYPSDLPSMNTTTGRIDGEDAVQKMIDAGFVAGSVVYLDIEGNFVPDARMLDYYAAWVQAVIDGGYNTGVYCSYASRVVDALFDTDSRPVFWPVQAARSRCIDYHDNFPAWDPSGSGVSFAVGWQLAIDCTATLAGHTLVVDFDSSLSSDPSAPPSVPAPSIPTAPVLLSPISFETVNVTPVNLSWTSGDASSYRIDLFNWNGSTWAYQGLATSTTNPAQLTGLVGNTYYAWDVSVCNDVGCSAWSDFGYFYYQGP